MSSSVARKICNNRISREAPVPIGIYRRVKALQSEARSAATRADAADSRGDTPLADELRKRAEKLTNTWQSMVAAAVVTP